MLAQVQGIVSITNSSIQFSHNAILRYREAVLYPGLTVR